MTPLLQKPSPHYPGCLQRTRPAADIHFEPTPPAHEAGADGETFSLPVQRADDTFESWSEFNSLVRLCRRISAKSAQFKPILRSSDGDVESYKCMAESGGFEPPIELLVL